MQKKEIEKVYIEKINQLKKHDEEIGRAHV